MSTKKLAGAGLDRLGFEVKSVDGRAHYYVGGVLVNDQVYRDALATYQALLLEDIGIALGDLVRK